jgi:hypothetical protein
VDDSQGATTTKDVSFEMQEMIEGHVGLRLLTCTLLQSLCAAELQRLLLLLLQQRADLPITA